MRDFLRQNLHHFEAQSRLHSQEFQNSLARNENDFGCRADLRRQAVGIAGHGSRKAKHASALGKSIGYGTSGRVGKRKSYLPAVHNVNAFDFLALAK